MKEEIEELKKYVRDVPDFPKEGVIFKDITPLLQNARAYQIATDIMSDRYMGEKIDLVVGVEARGFIMAPTIAYKLNAGFAMVRKPGKLPYKTHRATYELEYGTDALEIHQDAIAPGQRVLVIDDVLATGGTANAVAGLVNILGGELVESAFLIELDFLNGREKLNDCPIFSLIHY
jgi:adenine phosphoribosyltransferase